MAKFALCIDAKDHALPIDQWVPRLIDRAICETDETTLQIIPYIVLVDNKTREVFMYTRGKAGQEDRLHAKKSVGIGGHMDLEIKTNIIDLIASESVREIEEETGYLASIDTIKKYLNISAYHKLYTPDAVNPVDRVHIAISFIVHVDKENLTKLEDGVILDPTWISANDVYYLAGIENSPLENWSLLLTKLFR